MLWMEETEEGIAHNMPNLHDASTPRGHVAPRPTIGTLSP